MTAAPAATAERFDHIAPDDAVRPAFRAVFHRGPEGLTLQWVVQRERRDGEVQIVVGDPVPALVIPISVDEQEITRSAAD